MIYNNQCKVFVGNVPYKCTNDEFRDHFKHMSGYITADIKFKKGSKHTRGFGFVVFDTKENARKLIKKIDVEIDGRTLRFMEYMQPVLMGYKVIIQNISNEISIKEACMALSKYGNIQTCIIGYKHGKVYAIATYRTVYEYHKALLNTVLLSGTEYKILPYKRSLYNTNTYFEENFKAASHKTKYFKK